jgi:hypothetical protein
VIEGGTVYYIRADHIGGPVFATKSTGTKVRTTGVVIRTLLKTSGAHGQPWGMTNVPRFALSRRTRRSSALR